MNQNRRKITHALITGGSSGIGAALALAYAHRGVGLTLGGRNTDRLETIAASCRAAGVDVETNAIDVTNAGDVGEWIRDADSRRPLDLVIANAGISAGTGGGEENAAQARSIFAVNVDGVINTVQPAIDILRPRQRGQIAIMSSLAGFMGAPGAPAYSASKAAVRMWGDSLRPDLAADGIALSVICPGFVRSPMTDVNSFRMPFLMEAERAAEIVLAGLDRERSLIAFPLRAYFAVRLVAALPTGLRSRLLARGPRKD